MKANMDAIAFQARARTVDHLGREQIADCPTAVSELWKNSYDAYARAVHLHIFDGDVSTAILADDGHGMSRSEFIEKWLVLGTESKASGGATDPGDRNGLKERVRQGQKGIGRLSAAALGPLMLLLSKRQNSDYVATLIDWRLFQNPFLLLNDIKIPIVEFSDRAEMPQHLDAMFDRLMGNVWGDGEVDDAARNQRLTAAWNRFDSLEAQEGRESTRAAIEEVLIKTGITDRQLDLWSVWRGEAMHGTVMIVADIAFDLKAQLSVGHAAADEATVASARSRLKSTLASFTDPYVGQFADQSHLATSPSAYGVNSESDPFTYGVTAWEGDLSRTIVADIREFGLENIESLEHVVDGWINEAGVFNGRIKAFGKWLPGEVNITPESPVGARKDSRVGSFTIRLGTFEQELKNTTHEQAVHAGLLSRAESNSGFLVFRDGLRVLPYGREDNDFFEIERRRGMHAGREFWSIRRIFGRVALTRASNPNLKDKAGREGFIDNKAAKIFRDLVENILRITARRYFGSDSTMRKQALPSINASFQQQRAAEAQKKLAGKKRKDFRKNLAEFEPQIAHVREQLEEIAHSARLQELPSEEGELLQLRAKVEALREKQSELSLGSPPNRLGPLEGSYRNFRGNMNRANELVAQLRDSISVAIDRVKPRSQEEIAHSELARNASYLHARIRRWSTECKGLISEEGERIGSIVEDRNKQYHNRTLPLLAELQGGTLSLSAVLEKLDQVKEELDRQNQQIFESYLSVLRSLAADIDLESLLTVTIDENSAHREEIQRLNALAQLGITVEIVGHELSGFEGAITEGLRDLPEPVKSSPAYLAIKHGHDSISERLHFLAPLKLSGERSAQWVTGLEIAQFVQSMLSASAESFGVKFTHTFAFEEIKVFDQFARIAPVFVNLANNAIYWAARSTHDPKTVVMDAEGGVVYVSDNGPGVDPEDVRSLFTLFFTRKIRGGRGVGLYLCRANLAAGGHTIEYVMDEARKRLPGANFAVKFSTGGNK